MTTSPRFRQLKTELRRLRVHLLPKNWDPTGNYSERKYDRARAYRVLAHAEIEYYLENVLLDVVNQRYQEWSTNKSPSYVMTCLVVASKLGWNDVETGSLGISPLDVKQIRIEKTDRSLEEVIDRALTQYRDIVKSNNGIKSVDLKRLLMPVGIAISNLDSTWLNSMDSFGGKRGFVAHTSRLGIQNVPDPRSELQTVLSLLQGLEDLDSMILSI